MTTMSIPNRHNITVESGVATKGHSYVVVAKRWSIDQTAVEDSRWVRFDTEAEADEEATRIAEFNWAGIVKWFNAK
jgi:hypothetical protein